MAPRQLQDLITYVRDHPVSVTLGLSPLALLVHSTSRALYNNYVRWRNLGKGGFPATVAGWLVQWLLWPLGLHNMTTLWPYSNPAYLAKHGAVAKKSYLKRPLPRRDEERPLVSRMWMAPQRQESASVPVEEGVRDTQRHLLEDIVSNSEHLRIATSWQESHGPAIYLAKDLKPAAWAAWTRGECAHIHMESDWSGHASLTPADAMEVVAKGWGQRHALSHWFHIGYTMIYAPRTEEQMNVVREIYEAACEGLVDGAITC